LHAGPKPALYDIGLRVVPIKEGVAEFEAATLTCADRACQRRDSARFRSHLTPRIKRTTRITFATFVLRTGGTSAKVGCRCGERRDEACAARRSQGI
jgi:hypothetical protein